MNLFFKWRMQARWVENKCLTGTPSYGRGKRIGLLLHHQEEQQEAFGKLFSLLEKDHKSISVLSYHKDAQAHSQHSFSKKDVSFWGVLHSPSIAQFTREHHDVLINTSRIFSFYLEHLALRTRARLKVGFYDPRRKPYYHLLIKPTHTKAAPHHLLQMYEYLSHI